MWVGEVAGKFRGFKPSRRVEMVCQISLTSRQSASLRRGNGKVDIVEFGLNLMGPSVGTPLKPLSQLR